MPGTVPRLRSPSPEGTVPMTNPTTTTTNAQVEAAEQRLAEWREALTDEDAARVLGVSVRSIHNYAKSGRLKTVRLFGHVRFTRSALADCIQAGAPAKVA